MASEEKFPDVTKQIDYSHYQSLLDQINSVNLIQISNLSAKESTPEIISSYLIELAQLLEDS